MPLFLQLAWPFLAWGFFVGALWYWLRQAITPAWVTRLLESEGVPSTRLALAWVVVIFTLCMEAADRLKPEVIDANLFFAGTLLGLGVGKVVAARFASRPKENSIQPPDSSTNT